MRRSLWFLVVLALLAAPGCGRYASKNSHPKDDADDNFSVGGDVQAVATTTTSVRPGGGAETQTEDTAVAANQSRYDSPEGLRLVLTVDGSLNYRSGDDIKLSVLVRNISQHDVQFDPNDLRNFAFRPVGQGKAAWTDGDCRGARVPPALETSAQTLHPDEETTFVDTYPGPPESANRDQCRVGGGTYSAFGFVTLCPPGSTDDRGVCDPAKTKQISSAGVKIKIG